MKKKLSIIFLALALCVTAVFVTACGGKKTGEKSDYEWKYEKEFTDEHDADMTIDGALNEERWQGQQYLTHVQDGVAVNYTTVFTEKGLYLGLQAFDKNIQWYTRNEFGSNSSFGIKIVKTGEGPRHEMERAFQLFEHQRKPGEFGVLVQYKRSRRSGRTRDARVQLLRRRVRFGFEKPDAFRG